MTRKNEKLMPQRPIEDRIRSFAADLARRLRSQIDDRVAEMDNDNLSHYLIYRVLGVSDEEGSLIDIYQNKGRFLYKYAGSFLETVCKWCLQERFPEAVAVRIPNTEGKRPKTFEIDCLVGTDAIEIKWRDATTDGDHITKEHTRIKVIAGAGFTPIRAMFYYPNLAQAIRIQQTLETLYTGIGGHYYFGDAAWTYLQTTTDIDLRAILERLAAEKARQ
ncbi:MAG: ApaLI family restriction endonuclease [Thermodesulfobacteriota bacterium]